MEGMKKEAQKIQFIQEKSYNIPGKVGTFASGILGSIPGGIYSPQDIPSHDFRCILVDNKKTQPHFFKNTKIIDEQNLENVYDKGFSQTKDLKKDFIKTTSGGGPTTRINYPDIPLIYNPFTANTSGYLPGYDFQCILEDNRKNQQHFFKNTNRNDELNSKNIFDRQFNQQQNLKSDFRKTTNNENPRAGFNYPDIPLIYRSLISSSSGRLYGYDCVLSCATVDFYSNHPEDIPIRIIDYRKTQPHFFQGSSVVDSQQKMEPPEQLIYSKELDSIDGSGDLDIPDIPRRWAVFTHTNTKPTRTEDQSPVFSSSDISYIHMDNTKNQPHFYTNTKPIISSSSNKTKEHLSQYQQNDYQFQSQLPDQSNFISTKQKDVFNVESRVPTTKQSFTQQIKQQKPKQEDYDVIDYGTNNNIFDTINDYLRLSDQSNLNLWSHGNHHPFSSPQFGDKHFSHSDNSGQRRSKFLQVAKESTLAKSERIPEIYSDYLHNVRFNLEFPALEEQELFMKRKLPVFIPDIPRRKIDMTMSQPQFYFPHVSMLTTVDKQKLPKPEMNLEGSRLVSGELDNQINIPDIPRVYIRPEYRQPWFFRPAFIEES